MWFTRLLAAAIFIAVMLTVREAAHAVVAVGFIAWAMAFTAILSTGVAIENHDRRRDGLPAYSLAESRELVLPLCVLACIITISYWAD